MVFRATLRRGGSDDERSLVVRLKREPKIVSLLVAGDRSSFALSLHRDAGISISGLPRRGGTSIFLLGSRLARRMEGMAEETKRIDIGPLVVYSGRDF